MKMNLEFTAEEFADVIASLRNYKSESGKVTPDVIEQIISLLNKQAKIVDGNDKREVEMRPILCGTRPINTAVAPVQLKPINTKNFGHKGVGVAMLNDLGMEERRFKSKIDAVRHLQSNGILVSDKAIGKAIERHEQIGGFTFRYIN